MEPMVGVEPTTSSLRKNCSTTELHRRGASEENRTPASTLGRSHSTTELHSRNHLLN